MVITAVSVSEDHKGKLFGVSEEADNYRRKVSEDASEILKVSTRHTLRPVTSSAFHLMGFITVELVV